MITESNVTGFFCIADDFCKEFDAEMAKNALDSTVTFEISLSANYRGFLADLSGDFLYFCDND